MAAHQVAEGIIMEDVVRLLLVNGIRTCEVDKI